MFHLNLRIVSASQEVINSGQLRTHYSITSPQLSFQEIMKPAKLIHELGDRLIENIQKSSVEVPQNAENLMARDLELLAQKLKQGKIRASSVYGFLDEENKFNVILKLDE